MKFLLALAFVFAAALANSAESRPNIVLILADDLGAGDLSCYGHPKFKTPRLDRMAAEGARLLQFNTPTAFCAPTRAALLTGRQPFRCGMTQNPAPDGGPVADALALPRREITLAQVLRSAGYATGMIGKWHLGHHPGSLPTERGFEEYFGIPYSNDMRPVQLLEGTQRVEYPVVQATLTERYTARAVQFIEQSKGRPFFLYLAHAMPHKPLAASEKYYGKSGTGLYGDVLTELDAGIGAVLDALKAAGVEERTLVLFTSDNGPWYGGSTGGLRGMKGSTYEGGFRVPMIARWPGKIPAGHTSSRLATTMDLFATILAVTGARMPDERVLDGRDLWPVLTGTAPSPHEFIFGHKSSRLSTIRDERWKLHVLQPSGINLKPDATGRWRDPRAPEGVTILAPYEQPNLESYPGVASGDAPAAMQLFDLQVDPGEQRNVADRYPAEVERLKAAFDLVNRDVPKVEEVRRIPSK